MPDPESSGKEIIANLDEKELASLRQAFATFDKDGDGTIDASELKDCLKAMGMHPGPLEVETLLADMDENGDGVIDFEEFAAVMAERNQEEEMEEEMKALRDIFVMLDTDGNGRLDADEIREAMKAVGIDLTPEESKVLLDEIDTDGDGDVSFEEFFQYVWNFETGED